jgi:stearoyl-CoA desaturase (delta-9 desaturase)
MSTDNLIINTTVQKVSIGLTSMQIFAALTVCFTTLGAAVACWQIFQGTVGILEVALLLVFYFSTAIGIEAGFHRYFSHSAFKGGIFVTWMMGILGSMAAQGPVLFWAATHRKHHAFTDKDGDPHSPNIHGRHLLGRIKGLLHAHMGWLFTKEQASWAKFSPDLVRSRDIISINSSYLVWVVFGLLLPAFIAGVITQSWGGAFNGLIWGGLFRIFLLDHMTWTINSICHTVGSQPHESKDNSRNIFLLCIPSVGGSFHNNHHAYPIGARNDHQSILQLDLSGRFIEFLGLLGLASNIKRYKKKS